MDQSSVTFSVAHGSSRSEEILLFFRNEENCLRRAAVADDRNEGMLRRCYQRGRNAERWDPNGQNEGTIPMLTKELVDRILRTTLNEERRNPLHRSYLHCRGW